MQDHTVTIRHAASSETSIPLRGVRLLLPLLLALPFSASAAENKPASGKRPDKCMAQICLETPMTQDDIVAKYGPGRKAVPYPASPDEVQRCYYDPKQHLYIEFSFDKHQQVQVVYNSDLNDIVVSTFPMCDKKFTPKQPFPPFKTERGVGIGATEAEVLAAMGPPDGTFDMADYERKNLKHRTHAQLVRDHDSAVYGEKSLLYSPDPQHDLLTNAFLISHGKVKSIMLSNSE